MTSERQRTRTAGDASPARAYAPSDAAISSPSDDDRRMHSCAQTVPICFDIADLAGLMHDLAWRLRLPLELVARASQLAEDLRGHAAAENRRAAAATRTETTR